MLINTIDALNNDKEKGLSDEEGDEEVPEVTVDVSGHPILPPWIALRPQSQQHLVREVFVKAYSKLDCYVKP